jgi:4-oxalocrotonate tautomerase
MPMITVQYSTSRSERGLKAAVAQAASDLAAQILRKDPNVTAVLGSVPT